MKKNKYIYIYLFYLFILFIYLFYFIFCGLPVGGKKKRCGGARMGYCPFSKVESRYNKLYCDTRHGLGAHGHAQ